MHDRPEIERLQAVQLQPGDVIVATIPAGTSLQLATHVRDRLQATFAGHTVAVILDGVDIAVYRPADGGPDA